MASNRCLLRRYPRSTQSLPIPVIPRGPTSLTLCSCFLRRYSRRPSDLIAPLLLRTQIHLIPLIPPPTRPLLLPPRRTSLHTLPPPRTPRTATLPHPTPRPPLRLPPRALPPPPTSSPPHHHLLQPPTHHRHHLSRLPATQHLCSPRCSYLPRHQSPQSAHIAVSHCIRVGRVESDGAQDGGGGCGDGGAGVGGGEEVEGGCGEGGGG